MNYKKYVVMFLIIISSADISFADDNFVFGPTVYERTKGSTDIFVDNFSSPEGDFILHVENSRDDSHKIRGTKTTRNGETIARRKEFDHEDEKSADDDFSSPEGDFIPHVDNDGDDGHKISSATITLNGETIVRQKEFKKNVNSINKSIKLKSHNNLQVKLNSKPGGSITIYIHAAPVVEIEFPIKNAYHPVSVPLDGTPVEFKTAVTGTIRGNVTNATIKVNNEIFDVPVINGSFYQDVTLIENGNQISVSAIDTLGYAGNADIVAYVENTNKELTMPLPPQNPFENDKLGTGLNYTAYLYETQGMDAAVAFISRNPHNIVENGSIRVRIPVPEENETYISTLRSMGIDVLGVINATDIGGEILIEASLPISKIREAGELGFITRVYVVATPYLESTAEGDAIIGGDRVRSLGFTGLKPDGSKVKVAVIDGSTSPHEAKIMDVIQTIAPGANVTAYREDWNNEIENATANGVDIISVSQSAPNLDLDGTDPISKNITLARANGILYINAAGNYARLHYKGTYQDNNKNGWHEFASFSKGYDETLNAVWSSKLDTTVTAYLHLNPADADKLDIKIGTNDTEPLLLDSSQDRYSRGVRGIAIPVNGSSDVRIFVTNSSKYKSSDVLGTPFQVFILPSSRSDLPLSEILDKQNQWVDNYVKESSITAPATSRYSFTVGATLPNLVEPYVNTAAFLTAIYGNLQTNKESKVKYMILATDIKNKFYQGDLAYFSGQGPVYDAAGNTLIKPDVVAPTFVSTSHGIFGGTSASAPHVAGAAALVLSANPYLTPDEVQQALEESAVDLGSAGKDNQYGSGRIDVYQAVQKVLPDLRPTNIQAVRDSATKGFTVKADVNNAGHGVTRNVEVQFLKDSSVFNTSVIPVLKAGETVTLETKWMAENYGSYNISVIVDPGKKIPELDENNNYANVTVDVTGLPGWGFSKKLSIRGTTAGAQTNYQLKLTVRKGSGTDVPGTVYLGNNVRNDFGDIRFTRSDGVTLLDYWVESYAPGGSAEVWVEVDSIPESPGTADVYVYYGNESAASTTSGANTFIQWHGYDEQSFIDSAIVPPTNVAYEAMVMRTRNPANILFGLSDSSTMMHDRVMIQSISIDGANLRNIYATNNGVEFYYSETPQFPQDVWIRLSILVTEGVARYYVDGIEIGSDGLVTNLPDENMGLQQHIRSRTPQAGKQNFSFARKYVLPEPIWGLE
ncbi:Subtilisin-like serine protease [uncultured archaeon]|nr:Subtilisin-like serine protease [uncultured archaeon]